MSTTIVLPASPPEEVDAARLIKEIEQYLAQQAPAPTARTAHRLVSKTTAELVAEAGIPTTPTATLPDGDAFRLPPKWLRILPDKALIVLNPRRSTTQRRAITVRQHIELTILLLERWGWDHTPTRLRTRSGRRCILGAQAALYWLGYGTEHTARQAGAHLQGILHARGIREPFWRWNDRTDCRQVLDVLREAATTAPNT